MTLAKGPSGLLTLLAQATQPTTGPAASDPLFVEWFKKLGIFPLLAVMLLFYLYLSSGARKKEEKKKKELLDQMKRGTRVQTIGGIIGKVVETDADKVLLKVDESSNTKIWFTRDAIRRVLEEEKSETK
jgi:preprotein translocase subunit YajC